MFNIFYMKIVLTLCEKNFIKKKIIINVGKYKNRKRTKIILCR